MRQLQKPTQRVQQPARCLQHDAVTAHTAPGTIEPLSNLLRPPMKKWRGLFFVKLPQRRETA